jgi:hypothetical protein
MTYAVSTQLVQKHSVQMVYFAPSIPPIGRDGIIKAVIDLEYEFQLYLFAALRLINPNLNESQLGDGGIFSEPNMLSSLSKCLTLAVALDLVDDLMEFDIRKLVRLRNMYAHGRHRIELREDEEAQDIVRMLKIYANSGEDLRALEIGNAFFCCIDRIKEVVQEKREAL